MRALLRLACATAGASLCLGACAGAPSSGRRAGEPCDVLPLLGTAEPAALAADASGDLVVVGSYRGPLRGGNAVLDGSGAFVVRTDAAGNVRWMRGLPGAQPRAVAVLPGGDAVIAGDASGRCLVARYSPDGARRWQSAMGGDGSSCRALAASSDAVWVAGEFSGVLTPTLASRGATDAFVGQLGEGGEIRLVRTFGGKGRDVAQALLLSPAGVVVAGQFGGDVDASVSDVDFGRGAVRSAGDYDAFVVMLGLDGKTRWAATSGDNGDDGISALASGPDGAIYAAGHHQPSADHRGLVARDVGNATATLLRYSPQGRGEWVRIVEGPRSDAVGLAFDGEGRLWAAGSFLSELRLGALTLTASGREDAFALAVVPANGEPLGARSWGGSQRESVAGIAAIPGGIAVAGQTRGEIQLCQKAIGSEGEQTAFVLWLRDLTLR